MAAKNIRGAKNVQAPQAIPKGPIAIVSLAFSILLIVIQLLDWILTGNMMTRIYLVSIIFLCSLVGVMVYIYYPKQNTSLLILFVLPISIGITLVMAYYVYSYQATEIRYLAPSFRQFGTLLPTTSNYGTNARIVESHLYQSREPIGPPYFLRIQYLMFCDEQSTDCNAGWILANLNSYDASRYNYLLFEVRGKEGGEQVGIGLKDKKFTEVKLFDVGHYVSSAGKITTRWETAIIPLTEFRGRNIDLSALDNLSFFVDAQRTKKRTIQVDIANIRLK